MFYLFKIVVFLKVQVRSKKKCGLNKIQVTSTALGWLKQQKYSSHGCGGQSLGSRYWQRCSFEDFLLGLQMASFSMCLHIIFPPHLFVLISSSYQDTSFIGLGPILVHLCNFITPAKIFSPNMVTFLWYRRLGCQRTIF